MNNKYYPMNSAEVLDQVMEVYKKSFFKQLAVSVIFNIIFIVVFFIILFVSLIAMAAWFTGIATQTGLGAGSIIMIAGFMIFLLLGLSVYEALTGTGNALVTKQVFLGEHCKIGSVIKNTFKKMWIATAAAVANLIVFLPAFLVVGALIYLYITTLMRFDNWMNLSVAFTITSVIVLIVIVLAFFIICGTITMMSLSVAIFEGKWFFGAVKRSFALARPDFWKLVGLMAVWSVVTAVASYGIESFFSISSILIPYLLPQEIAFSLARITGSAQLVFSLALTMLLFPLSGIFFTLVYINQRIKHEGLDIELNLSALRTSMYIDQHSDKE